MTEAHLPLSNAQLSTIADIILNPNSIPIDLLHNTQQYLAGLEAISSVEAFRFQPVEAIQLSCGKAIDPFSAAYCIEDYYRTTQFIRALYGAILAAQKRFGNTPVHVFYVGTGPYAALMLPLTSRFLPQEIQFSLIEAHPVSFEMLARTIAQLGLNAYIKHAVCQDAMQIRLSDYEPIHVLITETMQAALRTEPQVAISRHLAPQLAADAFFLPERIHVWAGLSNPSDNYRRMMTMDNQEEEFVKPLGTLMELTRNNGTTGDETFPVKAIELPVKLTTDFPLLSLYTDIDIFGDVKLLSDHSVITLPQPVIDLKKDDFHGATIQFQYQIEGSPGFKIVNAVK